LRFFGHCSGHALKFFVMLPPFYFAADAA